MAAAPAAWDDLILVGRIARPHGIRGQVVVNPETDFVDERFTAGATFRTRSAGGEMELVIASARIQGRRPVVAFEGCRTVEDAERLGGLELRVPAETLAPLEPGTFYQHELVGCAVQTSDGTRVGDVIRVDGGTGGSVLAVSGTRGEVLIPLADEICVEIDVAARRIVVAPPEGLLELNEPSTRSRQKRKGRVRLKPDPTGRTTERDGPAEAGPQGPTGPAGPTT